MAKSSFTVSYRIPKHDRVVILGVTSIVPNLDGVLFFTENGDNHMVEHHEMSYGQDHYASLPGMFIEYSAEDDLEDYIEDSKLGNIKLIDGRN